MTWAIEQGAVGGMPLTGFAFGCASNADAFVPSPQQFIYFQGGGFDMSLLSFLEVDVEGNVNVSKLGKKPYLTAGCGGFVDITAHARKIVFFGWFEAGAEIDLDETGISVRKPGKFTKMVDRVEHVTFSGRRARELGQEVLYVTERCVMRLTGQGPDRHRDHAGDRPGARHRRGLGGPGPGCGGCDCDATVAAGQGPDGVDAMSQLHLHLRGTVAELRLDNPAKLNAFTVAMLSQLEAHCALIDRNPAIRCVLVTAEGDRAFCTGADINAWGDLTPADFGRTTGSATATASSTGWRGCRSRRSQCSRATPSAAGWNLPPPADIPRDGAEGNAGAARESGVGIVPGWSGTQRLARLLPEAVLKEMAVFGRRLSAERALTLGFVAEVADDPRAVAETIAAGIAATSPRSVEVVKYMIHAAVGEDAPALIEALASGMIAATADKAEGVAAFRAKRKPEFPGA